MAGQRILTNPWWEGPAYDGLWFPHRVRVEPSDAENVSLVFITDDAEDHLHVPTLRALSRQATILVPRLRDLSLRDFLLSLGFEKVIEMAHQCTLEVTPGLRATLYRHGDGNLLVLQGDGRTLVHANSAVQSGRRQALLETATNLRQHHKDIDLLFASRRNHCWVPHCVSFEDATVVTARQWDSRASIRFLDLVRFFEPRMAFPLEDPPLDLLAQARPDPAPTTASPDERRDRVQASLQPGDCILDDQFVPVTSRRQNITPLRPHAHVPLVSTASDPTQDETRMRRIEHRILRNLRERAPRLLQYGQQVDCRIDVQDQPEVSLRLAISRVQLTVERCEPQCPAPLSLRLPLQVLESWVSSVAGYRSLTRALGARWSLERDRLPEAGLVLDLVGRRMLPPTWTERLSLWVSHPRRAFDIWRQSRRNHHPLEPQTWERVDPYELLQPDASQEELPSIRIA